jgi:erythromycin esterase-like protein
MGQKDKLVLMGHNRHLSKDIGRIKNLGTPPGGKLVPSLGTFINRLLPDQVLSIWMLYDHGKSSQPFTWLSNEYASKPGSLNAILAKVGSIYLLPTDTMDARADLLKSEIDIAGIYNATFRTAISRQADAIFFVNKVNPLMP